VDYIVWPPLYLHENGPLLCKGVAQGKAWMSDIVVWSKTSKAYYLYKEFNKYHLSLNIRHHELRNV
jgi:hypothetical protein